MSRPRRRPSGVRGRLLETELFDGRPEAWRRDFAGELARLRERRQELAGEGDAATSERDRVDAEIRRLERGAKRLSSWARGICPSWAGDALSYWRGQDTLTALEGTWDSVALRRLLDAGGLRHPCDLDLLLFFHRHPTAIMASEDLAAFAGYDLAQVARSLDVLVETGVLRRSLNPTHIGRLYRFAIDRGGGWLPPLLRTASTPDGRREVMRLLQPKGSARGAGPAPSPPEKPRAKTEGANHA